MRFFFYFIHTAFVRSGSNFWLNRGKGNCHKLSSSTNIYSHLSFLLIPQYRKKKKKDFSRFLVNILIDQKLKQRFLLISFQSTFTLMSRLKLFPSSPGSHKISILLYIHPNSSTLAWKIPWTEEPGRLKSTGSLGVRHNWAISLSLFTFMHWRRKWQPTPVFLPG